MDDVGPDGKPADLDGTQAKAHRELTLAMERLRLVEDGAFAGIRPVMDAFVSQAVPKNEKTDELPASIPADVAASVLALLSAVGNAGE
jgi:hypothetical protein